MSIAHAVKSEHIVDGLDPYHQYEGTDLPDPKGAPILALTSKLAEIVGVEGPATVRTILDRYRVGAGYGKLKGPTREALESAIRIAITSRRIVLLSRDENDPSGNVLALPTSTSVRLRERGPRDLVDIPIEEIAALAVHLDLVSEPEEVAFAGLLSAYGLVRKTEGVKDRIRRALAIALQMPALEAALPSPVALETPPAPEPDPRPSTAEALRDKNGEVYRLRVYNEMQEVVLWAGVAVGREAVGETVRWTIQPDGGAEAEDYMCPPMVVKRLKA